MRKENTIILDETDKLLLQHEWESTSLKDKSSGSILFQDMFIGDPTCGIIDMNNNWAVVAGDHLTVWKDNRAQMVNGLNDVHAIRLKNEQVVEVLIDPWSTESAVWELNIETLEKAKVRDYLDYRAEPYTDEINW